MFQRKLWRDRDFLKLWTGQSISEIGSQVSQLALPTVAILLLGATPLQVGLLAACETLAFPVLGLFAGVWADRRRHRGTNREHVGHLAGALHRHRGPIPGGSVDLVGTGPLEGPARARRDVARLHRSTPATLLLVRPVLAAPSARLAPAQIRSASPMNPDQGRLSS